MIRESTPPADGGKKILTVILIAANLLMLVIAIVTIPPNLRGGSEKADAPVTLEPADTPDQGGESQAADTPGADFSTNERPDLEDFLWYTEDVLYEGVPADAAAIDNIGTLTGGWKALIIYDPNNEFDSGAMEFFNISLAGTEDDLSLILDWYLIFWSNEGKSFDETDMEDTVFNGKWEGGGLWASGAGTIRLTQFYEKNQKQYAVGTMDTPDGIPAFIALVRP